MNKIPTANSAATLTAILENLYKKAVNLNFTFPLPIQVIDSPDVAKAIFMEPEVFVKNYHFFENLSKGRFSANGLDWKRRVVITQTFYTQATNLLNESATERIYYKHLMAFARQSNGTIYETLIAAALEVVSKAFGLPASILWPTSIANRARLALIDQQAMAWGFFLDQLEKNQQELRNIYSEIETMWRADSNMSHFLDKLTANAKGIKNFNPVGEVLQNLFASTETAASSMLWILECLTRHPNLQENFNDDCTLDYFIDEVLRLFPPVPFVTRVCLVDTEINGIKFAQNESIIISIVGVQTNIDYWSDPLEFKPQRKEFVDASYSRHAYIPFLSGPRACAGMKLAKQEIKCGIQALLKVYSIQACSEPRLLEYGISSRPGIKLEPYLKPRMDSVK